MKPGSVRQPINRRLPFLLLMLLLPGFHAPASDSHQAWFEQAVSSRIADAAALRAAQSFQHDLDRGRLDTYFIEAGLTARVRPWLDAGLLFHRQYDWRDRRWLEENRPLADLTFKGSCGPVSFSDRNRIEYRIREDQDDATRYRNKATLAYTGWERGLGLKPYAALEAFVDDSARLRERNRTRTTLGLQAIPARMAASWPPWVSGLGLDGYVTRQRTKKDGDWSDELITGLQLGLTL